MEPKLPPRLTHDPRAAERALPISGFLQAGGDCSFGSKEEARAARPCSGAHHLKEIRTRLEYSHTPSLPSGKGGAFPGRGRGAVLPEIAEGFFDSFLVGEFNSASLLVIIRACSLKLWGPDLGCESVYITVIKKL